MRNTLLNVSACVLAISGIGTAVNVSAQVRVSQRDRAAILQAKGTSASSKSAKNTKAVTIVNNKIGVLIAIKDDATIASLEQQGFEMTGRIGNYVYGNVNVDNVDAVAATKGVKEFAVSRRRQLRNDLARVSGKVDQVQAGTNLNQAYDGTGVIAAIYDTGLDPNNINFNDADGNTRVKRLWCFDENENVDEYTDENISLFTTDDNTAAHGSHVLGTITGSCTTTNGGNDYHGVAPNADIAIGCGSFDDNSVLLGAQNIIDYAQSQGKPVAINMSLGDNYGPHDGTDTFTAALNVLAAEAPIVVSAGNEGNDKVSIIKTLTADKNTVKTIITGDYAYYYYSEYGATYNSQGVGNIAIWGADSTPFKVYLDIITSATNVVYTLELTETPTYVGTGTVYRYFLDEKPTGGTAFDTYYSKGFIGGFVELNEANGRYSADITAFLEPITSKGAHVAVRVEGSEGQKIYMYADDYGVTFTSNSYTGYTNGNADGSISNMACGHNTISIGAYNTRSSYGNAISNESVCSFSSYGVLNDGRVLPDVVAPGSTIYSVLNSKLTTSAQRDYDLIDFTLSNGKKYYYTDMQGTSMAAPFATGVCVLLLQANPNLTPEEIRTILKETATTMSTSKAGAGKINALEAVKKAEAYSSVSAIANDGKEITVVALGNNEWNVYSASEQAVNISVYALSGSLVKQVNAAGDHVLSLADLNPGIYVIAATGAKSAVRTKVIVR